LRIGFDLDDTPPSDPEVIEQLEGNEQSRVQRLERDMQELKDMIRDLKQE